MLQKQRYERDRKRKRNVSERNNRQCVHNTQVHSNKYIKDLPNKPTTISTNDRQVCECILPSSREGENRRLRLQES